MNCQIRSLTSIRKGIGKDHIPFLVNSNSIIASENVSGEVEVEIKEISEKLLLQNQRTPNPEGSKFFQIRRGPNPEESCFHKTGGVPIRRGHIFANLEGSQPGGVSILPIRKGPIFANPEGYCSLSTRRGIILLKDLGKQKKRL